MIPASRRRLVVLYVIVAALLIGLGGRLWYLQVLTGTAYASLARQDQVRTVIVPSVRGQILDDLGAPLVGEKPSLVVSVNMAVVSQRPRGGTPELRSLAAPARHARRDDAEEGAAVHRRGARSRAGPGRRTSRSRSMSTRPTSSRCRSWRTTASFPALPRRSSR